MYSLQTEHAETSVPTKYKQYNNSSYHHSLKWFNNKKDSISNMSFLIRNVLNL